MLKDTHAGTRFMHESFHKDDAYNYCRSSFAWANTLFGEFIIQLHYKRPWILGYYYKKTTINIVSFVPRVGVEFTSTLHSNERVQQYSLNTYIYVLNRQIISPLKFHMAYL